MGAYMHVCACICVYFLSVYICACKNFIIHSVGSKSSCGIHLLDIHICTYIQLIQKDSLTYICNTNVPLGHCFIRKALSTFVAISLPSLAPQMTNFGEPCQKSIFLLAGIC